MRKLIVLIIRLLVKVGNVNLNGLSLELRGIGLGANSDFNGERFFLKKQLAYLMPNNPILFDVGANIGMYTKMLIEEFPNAKIYSFEPQKKPFEHLVQIINGKPNITPFNFGFSSKKQQLGLFSSEGNSRSSQGSVYQNVLLDLHHEETIAEESISLETIDDFVEKHAISRIDFLKMDIEGHELEALIGAMQTLKKRKIEVIQFEFNEMNVVSKTFLKDFYDILDDQFELFRINKTGLYPLGSYSSKNEIFIIQNIVAIKRKI